MWPSVFCVMRAHEKVPVCEDFGMFLSAAGAYSALPGVVVWLGNNLAPSTKRGTILLFL